MRSSKEELKRNGIGNCIGRKVMTERCSKGRFIVRNERNFRRLGPEVKVRELVVGAAFNEPHHELNIVP